MAAAQAALAAAEASGGADAVAAAQKALREAETKVHGTMRESQG